jgi:phosphohistidine phosphatase
MIVGHLPFLGKLVSLLATGNEYTNIVAFEAGGMACLNRSDPGQWQIEWVITPPILD